LRTHAPTACTFGFPAVADGPRPGQMRSSISTGIQAERVITP
jgi:hypothetical protein